MGRAANRVPFRKDIRLWVNFYNIGCPSPELNLLCTKFRRLSVTNQVCWLHLHLIAAVYNDLVGTLGSLRYRWNGFQDSLVHVDSRKITASVHDGTDLYFLYLLYMLGDPGWSRGSKPNYIQIWIMRGNFVVSRQFLNSYSRMGLSLEVLITKLDYNFFKFQHHEQVEKYSTTLETLLFTQDLDPNILDVFQQFIALRM